MIVAIDGPSGAGKSTIAKATATKLGFSCMDTGAMFRCVALNGVKKGADLEDENVMGEIARASRIKFEYDEDSPYPKAVVLDESDVTGDIRTFEIDNAVTPVCKHAQVREELLNMQREMAKSDSFVIDGRDIGTVVFPNAEVKIYLDAEPKERARRRVLQNEERKIGSTDFNEVLADLERRDYEDMNRKNAPLRQADDAVFIDSTDMSIDEVVDRVCVLVDKAIS